MTGIYRWFINETQVYPTYKSDLSKDIEKETNQMFFRPKLNGKLRFKRDDYDFLNDSSFETEFILTCERFYEGIWQFDYKSRFMKTDCIWDIDHEVVEVTVETLDNYNKILAGQEKEFDLIKLNPAITALLLDKRPLIQIYSPSDDVVSCFIGGIYWEQPVKTVVDSESDLVNIYKFAQSTSMRKATLTNTLTPVIDVSGLYIGRSDDNMNRDLYRIEERYYTGTITGYGYSIVRNLDNVELYVCDTIYVSPVTVGVLTFRELSTDITNVSASFQSYHIYMRLLLDLPGTDTFRTLDIFPIPTDDILADNRNYRSVCPYQFDCIFINQLTSDTPTEYGKTDSGKYFIEPVSLLFPKFYPVARSQWGNTSLWFHYPIEDPTIDKEGRTLYTLKNNYKISDVIIALLKEIDTDIVHENDPDYSKFLYDQTGNPVYGDWFEVMITPKSNLRNGEYDQPAMKAPITLKTVFDMLRDVFQCWWYIEQVGDVKMLKIEHLNFFKHGKQYPSDPAYTEPGYSVDLTVLRDIRNDLPYGFGKNKYEFDKEEMPELYQFEWMDKVSKSFEGYPIKIVSNYVLKGKIDQTNVGMLTSDVDFILTNPDGISQDGFVLFGARIEGGKYKLPYINYNLDGQNLVIQNGLMSWLYLHPNFYIYDLPGTMVYVNNALSPVNGVSRKKKQVVEYPYDPDPDPLLLIKTEIGNGQVEKMSINLSSRKNNVTLKYDTVTIES